MFQPILLALAFATQSGDLLADPALSKSVSFSTRAANAVTAVKALGQAAGAPLAATERMKTEVLILRLDKVPLRDAMRRIAYACGGSWTLEKGIFYLGRTNAEEEQRRLSGRAAELDGLEKLIAGAKARIAAGKSFDASTATALAKQIKAYDEARKDQPGARYDAKSLNDFTDQMPVGRLKDAVLAQIDPKVLLDTPPGVRTIFSTDADVMERPLNIDVTDAVANFVKAQAVWADAMKPADPNAIPRNPFIFSGNDPVVEPVLKLDLVLDRTQQIAPNMEIELIGKGGAILASTQWPVEPDPPMPPMNQLVANAGETKLDVAPDELAEIQQLAASMGETSKVNPLSATALDHLGQPEKYDPLGTYVSSFYLQTAEILGKSLVADVPDAFMMLGPTAARISVPTATSWLKMTEAIGPIIAPTKVEEKWIEIDGGRSAPTDVLSVRASRRLLGNLFADVKSNGLTVGALGRYAFESNQPGPDFMSILKLSTFGANIEFERWDTLRILGALLAKGGELTARPQQIAFTALDRPTIDLLTEIVFYHHSKAGRVVPVRSPRGSDFLGYEPCDEMPQGLPSDGYLTASAQDQEVAYADGPRTQACLVQTLAWNTFMKNHPDRFRNNGFVGPNTSDKFRMGGQQQVSLNVHLAEGSDITLGYTVEHKPSGDAVPFESLPPKFVSEVKAAIAELEKDH